MNPYEALVILPPEATPEVRKNQVQSLENIIKKSGGSIDQTNDLGRKLLGYPLRKHQEGHFLTIDFRLEGVKVAELRKVLNLQEDVLKYMITVKVAQEGKKSDYKHVSHESKTGHHTPPEAKSPTAATK